MRGLRQAARPRPRLCSSVLVLACLFCIGLDCQWRLLASFLFLHKFCATSPCRRLYSFH